MCKLKYLLKALGASVSSNLNALYKSVIIIIITAVLLYYALLHEITQVTKNKCRTK